MTTDQTARMLFLVTDTSGKHGSVALAQAGPDSPGAAVRVVESVPLAGGMFSAQLVPQLAALLAKHGFSKKDIGAFVVVSGPGSFTGLRVGLSAIKALAEILGKPIVPVSLLEVVALGANVDGTVLAVLDAGRGEVFAGEYLVSSGVAQMVREQLLPREEAISLGQNLIFTTPDAQLAEMARSAGLKLAAVDEVSVEAIARLGWAKLQANQIVSPAELDANYMRRSDAELFSKPHTDSTSRA